MVTFRPNLAESLESADKVYLRIRKMIDDYITEKGIDAPPAAPYVAPWTVAEEPKSLDLKANNVNAVIWSTGFRAEFSMVDIPVFNGFGYPGHHRGVTTVPGLYFLGLGWLWDVGLGAFLRYRAGCRPRCRVHRQAVLGGGSVSRAATEGRLILPCAQRGGKGTARRLVEGAGVA